MAEEQITSRELGVLREHLEVMLRETSAATLAISEGVAQTTDAKIEGLRVQIIDVEGQLNRRIATQQRELLDQRHYFDAILLEKDRALDLVQQEREKRLDALREEQTRASDVAERERVRSAEASATSLARSIHEGDERLREHIAGQIRQIEAALVSAEKLSGAVAAQLKADVEGVDERSKLRNAGMQESITSRFEYTEAAVSKAEAGNEKRFADANEWREQTAARERAQQEQNLRLSGTFLPREVAEAQFEQMRRNIADLTEKLGKLA